MCEKSRFPTKWGPQTIAKLVNDTTFTMVYDTYYILYMTIYIYIADRVYKPTNRTGGAHLKYDGNPKKSHIIFSDESPRQRSPWKFSWPRLHGATEVRAQRGERGERSWEIPKSDDFRLRNQISAI